MSNPYTKVKPLYWRLSGDGSEYDIVGHAIVLEICIAFYFFIVWAVLSVLC